MEQAEMIERIRQKAFFKNNGMVLKAVNLLRDKFVALTDIRYALEPSMTEAEFRDSINYLTRPRDVQRTFARLHDAIAPGGSLVFDVHAVSKMEKLDGEVLLDEREDVFCLWRTRYRKNVKMLDYEVDLFRLQLDGAWERDFEEHHQRAYTVEELTAWLEEAGFTAIRTHGELKLRRANERDGRIYFSCIRK